MSAASQRASTSSASNPPEGAGPEPGLTDKSSAPPEGKREEANLVLCRRLGGDGDSLGDSTGEWGERGRSEPALLD